jgi:type 2 lantibiotic biosynthesis protein LanM
MIDESSSTRRTQLGSADWYKALSLTERLVRPGGATRSCTCPAPALTDVPDGIRRRLARWKSQPPFDTTPLFADRLAADGISETDLLALLAESPESLRQRAPVAEWAARIELAFSTVTACEPISWPEEFQSAHPLAFLESIQPLIDVALAELRDRIRRLLQERDDLPFGAGDASLFLPHLPQRLLARLSRTFVLELNVARVQGLLAGETAEQRFASFLGRIRSPDNMLPLLREYPVLGRELIRFVDHWVSVAIEFLGRLASDWPAISEAFYPGQTPGRLVEVKGDAGDRHRQGRSVFLLRFDSGFRLVYKPKSLAVDIHFQQLLNWINEKAQARVCGAGFSRFSAENGREHALPNLSLPRVLDRGSYGWVEFVDSRTCQSADEVALFYRRQGAYLALFYVLGAIDFHHENLIAQGEHPVPLDLEALFHPIGLEGDKKNADYLANVMLYNSVFGVGLLPGRIWSNPESEGVDMSGLGALPGQLFPFASPAWEGQGTDQMRLIRKRYTMPEAQNRPSLKGEAIEILPYTEELITGFREMYRFLEEHRRELLAADGPLTCFDQDEVRVVVRATRTYADLLSESFHPDVLRNALDRDRLFDRLWNGAGESPYVAKLIPAERSDLWNGDVPMFTSRPTSRDLWTSTGERIAGVLEETGMVRARRRLETMGDEDLGRQLWFIRASLATLAPARPRPPDPVYQLPQVSKANPAEFLAAARAVADRLEALAVRGEDDVSWIGLAVVQERTWSLVPLGTDFYDGLPGLAFFLAYLGSITAEERYTRLARAALTTLRNSLRLRPEGVTSIGAFAGWGGLVYTWTHLGTLWRDPALLTEAESFVERLPDHIDKDNSLDIIDGSAGCLLALLGLQSCLSSKKALEVAVRCGERLLVKAQEAGQGVGWMTPVPSKTPLAGMSHGAAGIAWALFALAARTGDPRFRDTAQQAIAYERGLFSVERGTWPDFRDFTDEPAGDGRFDYMTAWCHGAAGIGLARLACLPYLDDPLVRADIDAALKTTRAKGFGWNHTLCHGDLGNLELLVQAGRFLPDSHWRSESEQIGSALLETIRRDGWICANPVGVESPGLMTGIGGIGYGLLCLAEPERVPCILTLEPPIRQLSQ